MRKPTNQQIDTWLQAVVALPHFADAEHLYDPTGTAGRARLHNLRSYLQVHSDAPPSTLLVGEAPGYRGTRRTGIPFVSPDMLAGSVPGVVDYFAGADLQVADDRPPKPAEVTSAVVWRTLLAGSEMPLLWAAYPHHPHLPGNPLSNRTPTADEIAAGRAVLVGLIELFDIERVVAVGNVAAGVLARLGIAATKVRHPARGGSIEFRDQVQAILTATRPH